VRLSKIESDYLLQTPTVPVRNQSYIEIYSEEDGISMRPVARLEPEYPAVETPVTETFHERYPKISLPIHELDSSKLLSLSGRDVPENLSARLAPGTQKETQKRYLDWEDLTNSINSEELGNVFSNIIDNEIRIYEDELYSVASSVNESLDREPFSDWISERPNFVYQTLVRNCRPGGINEFEVGGAFYDQITELENTSNLEGGRIIKGSQQIGIVESQERQDKSVKYGLKSVEGIIVPEENETLEEFLESFSR